MGLWVLTWQIVEKFMAWEREVTTIVVVLIDRKYLEPGAHQQWGALRQHPSSWQNKTSFKQADLRSQVIRTMLTM